MIRFFIALWVSKFVYLIYILRGKRLKTDMPGVVAYRLCPDFLSRISKPELVICITGTNGKTTTSTLVYEMLERQGYKVSFNPAGYNLKAGYCLNLMRGVNIFNKCKIDASVLESDELTLSVTMNQIVPNYVFVTNICKDSLRRNGHPDYIFSRIEKALNILGDRTTLILNANDPISSALGETAGCKRIFYRMNDCGLKPAENIAPDIKLCPHCNGKLVYDYRFYRHIGSFHCTSCDYSSANANYYAENVDLDSREITITESDGSKETYRLLSGSIFNAFNVLNAVTIFRTIGISQNTIKDFFSTQKITERRESSVFFDGVEYLTYAAKAQNVSAASIVFEYVASEPINKVLVFCMDELQDRFHPTETVTWLYETDYEVLKSPYVKQIVIGGKMYLNHKLRLLLAGVDPDKIVCVEDDSLVPSLIDVTDVEKVYVLFEIDFETKAKNWRDAIVDEMKRRKGEK